MVLLTLDPIDTLVTFNCINVCFLNTSSQVIQTLIYVVESKFLLPRDVNLVGTQYVVSKLKNTVELIDRIDILDTWRYVCDVVYQCIFTFHAIYTCDWRKPLSSDCLVYTIVPVDCGGNSVKKNCLSLAIMWQIIISIAWFCRCVLIPPIDHIFLALTIDHSARLEFKNWTYLTNLFFLFPPLNHTSTCFISLLLLFFPGFIFISHPYCPPISSN